MIKPRRPAPAIATRVSGAALPEDDAVLPELVELGDPEVWPEVEAPVLSSVCKIS